MINKRVGWALGIAATVAYSTNTPIARGAIVAGMNPITLLIARFAFASLLFSVAMGGTPLGRKSTEAKPLDRRGILIGFGTGMLNGLLLAALFSALHTVSASIASMTTISLIQVFTLAILMLAGERLTRQTGVRLAVGLLGLYLLLGIDGTADTFGLFLLVVAAAIYAIHIVSVQWYLSAYNIWWVTTIIVAGATVSIAVLWVMTGMDTFVPMPIGLVAILVQGVVSTFIGRILTYSAVNAIGSGQFALLSPLETMLTILWAALFLGERLTGIQWLGTLFILVSILLAADIIWQRLTQSTEKSTSQ
ncbi:MAG: DMT family transporter [Chloroflexota bacterium]